jgi:glutaminase
MPAKSGVAGGVVAVLPGQLGIGIFSPRLDKRGNSVRGVKACRDLSRDFNLHFLRVPRSSRSAIRAQYDISEVSSKRMRADRERKILDTVGHRAQVYDLQGDLSFAAIEAVVRRLVEQSEGLDFAIIDLKRVTQIEQTASELLTELVLGFGSCGKSVLFVNIQNHSRFLRFLEEKLITPDQQNRLLTFPDMDPAIEWCEDRLIAQRVSEGNAGHPLSLAEHELCRGLEGGEIELLEKLMERHSFAPGQLIVRKGDEPDRIYLLMVGQVSVTVALPNGHLKRLATLSPGMAFGELAVVDRGVRTADVRADKPVECCALSISAYDQLGRTHPRIKMTFLENLLRNVSQMVSKLNQEVTTLAQ